MRKKGFTLIELIMIIVILGILAAVAIPKYYDLSSDAKNATEKGVVGGVRAGISTFFANNKTFPSTLDNASSAACTKANPCFTNVLGQGGVTDDWSKTSGTTYTGPASNTYTYNSTGGEFS
ncbi:MAG: prepilin-type N-terminal cleavage/methylation domain-containing protein [Candidatus Omnitrophota bacterium]